MDLSRRAVVSAISGAVSAIGITGSASANETETTGWGEAAWGAGGWGGRDTADECFIATAACGTKDHDRVVALRDFRDRRLATNRPGRLAIKTYYTLSPPIARWIGRSDRRKRLTRQYIVRPISKITDYV